MPNQKIKQLIIGVGNPLRCDDGIGPHIIKLLLQQKATSLSNHHVDLIDGGTDSFALLDIINQYPTVIIVDAVNMGAEPGTIKVFTPAEAKIKISNDALSTHGFGLAEMLKLMDELGIKTQVTIIGIQPQTITFGNTLSDKVNDKTNAILALIHKMVRV
jgi:hydrogenase maturation protease